MQTREADENPYYELVARYLERRANGLSDLETAQGLTDDPAQMALARLVVEDLTNPSDIFRFVKLPNCPNCGACELRADCVTTGRLSAMEKLFSAMASVRINQMELSWVD
jgi:hypothetical protein